MDAEHRVRRGDVGKETGMEHRDAARGGECRGENGEEEPRLRDGYPEIWPSHPNPVRLDASKEFIEKMVKPDQMQVGDVE